MIQYNQSMNPTHPATFPVAAGQLPAVPLTVEGYAMLHQMMRFRWTAWRALADDDEPPVNLAFDAGAPAQPAVPRRDM